MAGRIFITKVWGFGTPVGPLQFSVEGWRDRAKAELKDGDLVVLVGTKGEQTDESEQGKLLGIMEPSNEPVMSLDFDLRRAAHDFDELGNYRWPYGLLNKRAWRLIDRPLLSDISPRKFNMDAAQGIVLLNDQEAAKVIALSREEAPLLEPRISARARVEGVDAARKRSSPPPTTTRRGVMHMRSASAYTYAFEVKGASKTAFKIGWAFDFKIRARQFNQAAMPALGGVRYTPVLFQLWDTARQAYHMEQLILRRFSNNRHRDNHELISDVTLSEIQSVWFSLIKMKKRS